MRKQLSLGAGPRVACKPRVVGVGQNLSLGPWMPLGGIRGASCAAVAHCLRK